MLENRDQIIVDFIKKHQGCTSSEIHAGIGQISSYATVKRTLARLTSENLLMIHGQGKGTRYLISPLHDLLQPVDLVKYFEKEIDDRVIKETFNFQLITDVLNKYNVFSKGELAILEALQQIFLNNISQLSETARKKEMERLAIDLSWKSSQIEGNTYSLLETERLLKEKHTASGKTREEATMLLNHKETIDFILENPDYLVPLNISKIEDIHSMLVNELAVDRNIRRRRVGISGTNYRLLDNEYQIVEALRNMCDLINVKENVFEKALLSLVLISYIQPFMDGNKRTARIVSNAILINYNYCPISFRTVDSVDYKKAMILFYEQNNISAFKEIFIGQYEFAVNTYF